MKVDHLTSRQLLSRKYFRCEILCVELKDELWKEPKDEETRDTPQVSWRPVVTVIGV